MFKWESSLQKEGVLEFTIQKKGNFDIEKWVFFYICEYTPKYLNTYTGHWESVSLPLKVGENTCMFQWFKQDFRHQNEGDFLIFVKIPLILGFKPCQDNRKESFA